jgi:hypothetical protein
MEDALVALCWFLIVAWCVEPLLRRPHDKTVIGSVLERR